MIVEDYREGIYDLDSYYQFKRRALSSVRSPPPSESDINEFKEAYADASPDYNWDDLTANNPRRALVWWSNTFYTGEQLKETVPQVISSYNAFDSVETIQTLLQFYPDALFLPARESSVCVYVFSADGQPLRQLSEQEVSTLKARECDFWERERVVDHPSPILRLQW